MGFFVDREFYKKRIVIERDVKNEAMVEDGCAQKYVIVLKKERKTPKENFHYNIEFGKKFELTSSSNPILCEDKLYFQNDGTLSYENGSCITFNKRSTIDNSSLIYYFYAPKIYYDKLIEEIVEFFDIEEENVEKK